MFISPVCIRRDTSTGGRNIQILLERSTGSAVEGHCRFHTTSGVIRRGNCAHDTMDVIGGCILLHHICKLQTLTYVLHTFTDTRHRLWGKWVALETPISGYASRISPTLTPFTGYASGISTTVTPITGHASEIYHTNVHYRVYTSGIYLPL